MDETCLLDRCLTPPPIDDLLEAVGENQADRTLTLRLAEFQHTVAQHFLRCLIDTQNSPETNPLRGQGQVIAALRQEDGVPTKDLAARLDIRTASLNELLVKLEAKGLVERRRSAADGRVVEVYLTDSGRAVRQAPFLDKLTASYAALSTQEKEDLAALLERLTQAIANTGAE